MQQLTNEQLVAAATEYGTPLYVYHAEQISEQYEVLKHSFSATDARFFYASKALTNINILKYIKRIGCGIDCSSINEVHLALNAGFKANDILYTSSNIAFSEIETAVEKGVHINIDSLSNLEKFGLRFGHTYPVGIRLRPNIMAGGYLKISTGHDKSKFGIPLEDMDRVMQLISDHDIFIRTLHIHTGSEIKDVEVFAKGIEVLFEIASYFKELEVLDLGGGFKVPYQPGDTGTDIQLLGEKVTAEFAAYEKQYGRHLQVWFEPGKFLVSAAGYLVAKVNVIKETSNIVFAGLDTGLNHLIRPMFYGAYHIIENISNADGAPHNYHVVGNICETDTFAEDRTIPQIREGDFLAFRNAGAYGIEMASNYNARFRPAEVLFLNNQPLLIRRREVLEDLLRNQVDQHL